MPFSLPRVHLALVMVIFVFLTHHASAVSNPTLHWWSTDVGAVGEEGSAQFDSETGRWVVHGAGGNIWGTADAFHYVYRQLNGDAAISAVVSTIENTHTFAKAGLMIRDLNNVGSKHVTLNVRPNGSWEFLTRHEYNGVTTATGGGGASVPRELKLVRTGDRIEAFIRFDADWQSVAWTTMTLPSYVNVGLAVSSHDPGQLNTSTFEAVTLSRPGFTEVLPEPWEEHDFTGQDGGAAYDPTMKRFAISAAGSNIWGTADTFRFVSQPVNGDVEIFAVVTKLDHTSDFAKAGLMLRENLTAMSAHVIFNVRPTGHYEFMTRSRAGETTTFLAGGRISGNATLRLTRIGNTVTASVAGFDSWIHIASVTTNFGPSIHAGLAVTSQDPSQINTAWFEHVTVGPPQGLEVVLRPDQYFNKTDRWSVVPDATAAHGIKLTTEDRGDSAIDRVPTPAEQYVDFVFGAKPNIPYTIWLRVRAVGDSKWNDSIWVQFGSAFVNESQVYEFNSPSGLLVNLATDSTASSVRGWGWVNGAYWLSQPATVTFRQEGPLFLRVHIREDGVELDQIVLSSGRYLSSPPGPRTNDNTIVR